MSSTHKFDLADAIIGSTIAEIDAGETDPALAARDKADHIQRERAFLRLKLQAEAERDFARKLYLTRCIVRSIYSLVVAILAAGIFSTLMNPSILPWIVSGSIGLTIALLRTGGLALLPRNTARRSRDHKEF